MKPQSSEKGQVLILIAFGAIGLIAFAALAIDGSMLFSDRRHAQNAADSAALAGALAHARGNNITDAATDRAITNGYQDDGVLKDVAVTIVDSPSGVCPVNTAGKDITVTIVSTINTTFARVLGRNQLTNTVTATSRACGTYTGPPFPGNAIITLGRDGQGYDGSGNANWNISGGGIFSNSSDPDAAYCNGNIDIIVPSVTVVGGTDLNNGSCNAVVAQPIVDDADQLNYSNYRAYFPRQPACDGTATFAGGIVSPDPGADGSEIAFDNNANMEFEPGLYCITSTNPNVHGELTGTNVTFYVPSSNFSMVFNGGGSLTASAPTSGEYDGMLFYLAPQFDANGELIQTQDLQLLGNGSGDIVGTIMAPSATVIMRGNSGSDFNTQVIAYDVTSNGTSDVVIVYDPDDNFQATLPITLTLLK
jgi:hypothetical protein